MERDDIAADPRFRSFETRAQHSDAIRELVAGIIPARTTADWLRRFEEFEVLASAVADFGDWLADPQAAATRAAPLVDQPGMGAVPIPAIPGTDPEDAPVSPAVGQHGRDILGELGYGEEAIGALVRDGAVRLPD
jgi:formyl-CoA transferase